MNIFVCRVDKFPRSHENVLSGVMGFKIRLEASELTLLPCIAVLACPLILKRFEMLILKRFEMLRICPPLDLKKTIPNTTVISV